MHSIETVSPQSNAVGSNEIECEATSSSYNEQETLKHPEMSVLAKKVDISSLALPGDIIFVQTLIPEVDKRLIFGYKIVESPVLQHLLDVKDEVFENG